MICFLFVDSEIVLSSRYRHFPNYLSIQICFSTFFFRLFWESVCEVFEMIDNREIIYDKRGCSHAFLFNRPILSICTCSLHHYRLSHECLLFWWVIGVSQLIGTANHTTQYVTYYICIIIQVLSLTPKMSKNKEWNMKVDNYWSIWFDLTHLH